MDSGKSTGVVRELDPNITIKEEPGTSASVISTSLKTETNASTAATTTRLTSFRVPRDLTLGGNVKLEKTKRTYTPNLNVTRNKSKDDQTATKSNAKSSRERGRGRGQGQRGRGRGKMADNIIQTAGVFSEGIADSPRAGRKYSSDRSSSDRGATQPLEKQKLNLNREIDKADEEQKLKNLLRDDFIENGAAPDMENAPVMLPMADEARLYKEEVKEEPVMPKSEILDEDVKPVILENGKVAEEKPQEKCPLVKKPAKEEKKLITVPQIVANESNNYILLQFPDCLPALRSDEELSDTRSKKGTAAADSRTHSSSADNPKTNEHCTLNNLKEGFLGKLQILKSGNARLVLGDNKLIVDVGSHISFRQDLIAAKLDTEKLNGDLINLGSIGSTLICLPDWESMLANV